MRYKPTILMDLDGVLNEYKGNFDENFIPKIKNGAKDFVKELAQNYKLYLFTTRKNELAKKWLEDNTIDEYFEEVTNTKIPAFLILDDRGLKFEGNYQNTLNLINQFKAWYNYND